MELRIRDVSTSYGNGVQALSRVSLTIPRGVYGLLGTHGAGKSTLLRIIATLQEPDEGSISLDDIEVLGQRDEARQALIYLPQAFTLFPRVTAENLVDYVALMKGIVERRARREVVEAFLQPSNRQRFSVALARLGDPKLIIADEPTTALDPKERARFLDLLSALGEDSIVILATRSVQDVRDVCTRLAIIDRGEILREADPEPALDVRPGRRQLQPVRSVRKRKVPWRSL